MVAIEAITTAAEPGTVAHRLAAAKGTAAAEPTALDPRKPAAGRTSSRPRRPRRAPPLARRRPSSPAVGAVEEDRASSADVYLLFCLGHGDAWPAGDIAVQEGIKVGLGLPTRPTEKQMAPLAEPWRPLRGAAAHLWWSYYRAIKNREGVIAGTGLAPQPLTIGAGAVGHEVDHRADGGEIYQVRVRKEPEIGDADELCGATRTRSG